MQFVTWLLFHCVTSLAPCKRTAMPFSGGHDSELAESPSLTSPQRKAGLDSRLLFVLLPRHFRSTYCNYKGFTMSTNHASTIHQDESRKLERGEQQRA